MYSSIIIEDMRHIINDHRHRFGCVFYLIPYLRINLTLFLLTISSIVSHRSQTIAIVCFRSIRVYARTNATFTREIGEETQHVTAHFTTRPQLVSTAVDYDFDQLLNELNLAVHDFNERGSSFVFDAVTGFVLVVTEYRPLSGSTFVPTPSYIAKKKAVINVRNNDNRCFECAILSCLYPAKNPNPNRVSNYLRYQNTLNFDGITFPVDVKQISKFEKQNPEISVNVISLDSNDRGFCIEYMSAEPNRKHHINLLLLDHPVCETSHYVYIKNFSRLLGDRTKDCGRSFVCNSCLNVFTSQRVLDSHIPHCLQHAPQQVVYPNSQDPTNAS